MPTARPLQAVSKAIKAKDPETAWSALAQLWATCPAPALLDLTRALDSTFPSPPFQGAHAPWLKQAAKPTWVQRGSLLRTFRSSKLAETADRLKAIAGWSPDPRVSLAVEQLLREAPYTSDSSKKLWKVIFTLMVGQHEARFATRVPDFEKSWSMRENMKAWLASTLRKEIAPLAKLPAATLEPADEKELEAILSSLSSALPAPPTPRVAAEEERMLQAVYATLDDDAPRLAYASFLEKAGDPRGEYLRLALLAKPTPEQKKRKAELQKIHGPKWVGWLGAALYPKSQRFERGFPCEVTLAVKTPEMWSAITGRSEWRTLERIRYLWANPDDKHLCHLCEEQRGAKALLGLDDATVRWALATEKPWPTEELESNMEFSTWEHLVKSGLFPKLKSFTTRHTTPPKGTHFPIPRGLEELAPPWFEEAELWVLLDDAKTSDLKRIGHPMRFFSRDAAGEFKRMEIILWNFVFQQHFDQLKKYGARFTELRLCLGENRGHPGFQKELAKNALVLEDWCSQQPGLKSSEVVKQKKMA